MAGEKGTLPSLRQYWATQANELLHCSRRWEQVVRGDFTTTPTVEWLVNGELNAAVHCVDRHLTTGRRNKAALIWQGERDHEVRVYTYQMLFSEVCRLANVMKKKGIGRGDCVAIYLPMVPELVVAMLACARIGAPHTVVFSGFSAASLQSRLEDCRARMLITADGGLRAGRSIPLKPTADSALEEFAEVGSCLVVRRTDQKVEMVPGRDSWYHSELSAADISSDCEAESMAAGDPLFFLYTSGATGLPKQVRHGTGGYLLHALSSCRQVFRLEEDDIFWSTADLGWITGHTYSVYGPLGLGGTVLLHEGVPLYPGAARFWQVVEKFRVNKLYTAPAVIRALRRAEGALPPPAALSSLRLVASVGEPVDPGSAGWFAGLAGRPVPVIDTWCQTEAGGILFAPRTPDDPASSGTVGTPLPGIDAAVVDESGHLLPTGGCGRLLIRHPWPGMALQLQEEGEIGGVVTDGGYDTGDLARRDEENRYVILGRQADLINVAGQQLGTAEIEAALLAHPSIIEAAAVGIADTERGQAVYAFVTPRHDVPGTRRLLEELRSHLADKLGPAVLPVGLQCAPSLPKTKSGKIVRRLLRKIASGEDGGFGDLSALADPSVLAVLLAEKRRGETKIHLNL